MRLQIAAAFLSCSLAQAENTTGTDGGFNTTLGGGGGLLGSNPCTYAPNATCYPNPLEPGRPLCCTIDPSGQSCSSDEPCFTALDIPSDFNISNFNMTDLPIELGPGPVIPGGGNMLGTSICTFAPDKSCWPTTGWPPCCDTDPSSCPSTEEFELGVNPPCEQIDVEAPVLGANQCTYAPNETCYPNPFEPGRPFCCTIDPTGQSCVSDPEPCFEGTDFDLPAILAELNISDISDIDITDLQDLVGIVSGPGTPISGVGDLVLGGDGTLDGANPCTYAPDTECYPSNNGWPMCCKETPDGSSCTKDEPCEENTESEPNTEPAPSGEEAVKTEDAVLGDPSSSNILSMSLIALVGAHAVAFVTGMW